MCWTLLYFLSGEKLGWPLGLGTLDLYDDWQEYGIISEGKETKVKVEP